MTQTTSTLVRKEIVVDAPVERAFTVFTERIGDFKPPEHNLLRVPIVVTVFEPRVGGHIIDRGEDGSECRWASILAYDPPHRVAFSWNIGSRSTSRRSLRTAPGSSWSTATSTGTDLGGRRSTTASRVKPAGRCT
jgi:uncharacterized protein YndB with AHSA1/START domain